VRPVQYIIANQGANMSPGKLAAQVAHAAVKGCMQQALVGHQIYWRWNETGHTKIVLSVRDDAHMHWAHIYLAQHGFEGHLIIDEGRTEIDPLTPTALGFPILDKDDEKVQFAFSTFELYKEPKPEIIITAPPADFGISEKPRRWWRR
jgi:PTH2 family peptidyl-tRNA hydrolase